MKIIYTKNFPPGTFHAINIFGILFVQRKWGKMEAYELRHEHIHTLQQKEMGFIFFYLWYGIEYIYRLFQFKFDRMAAYYHISFEQEAYTNQHKKKYRKHRKHYSWIKFMRR